MKANRAPSRKNTSLGHGSLNFSDDNYNFGIDVLEKVWLKKLKIPFSSETIFKVLCGAKGFGKTYLICLLALFYTCNFADYNCVLSRYTFVSARDNYYSTMTKVANDLTKYGVRVAEAINSKEIKSWNSDLRCEWMFDNGRVIRVIGFDNTERWEGIPAIVGEWGYFAIDEVIPLKEKIIDDEDYLYQLFNAIIQIIRGQNLSTSFKKEKRLECNGWQIFKQQLIIFGFNNHNTDHPIYQFFVNSIIPLNNKIKKELEENDVSYGHDKKFLNVGATVIRGTTKINENNLNKKLIDLGEGIKERFPEVYTTLFMGGEHDLSIDKYSYRKDLLENAKFFNPEDFFWDKDNRYWFDEIRIGCDYADGGETGDDAVAVLMAYEFDLEGYVKEIYILEELSISTRRYKNMTDKVDDIAKHLDEWSKKYEHKREKIPLEKDLKFRIGHDSRTVRDFLKDILVKHYGFKIEKLDQSFSLFKATGPKSWSVNSRHYVWKRLLSEKKIYFSKTLTVYQEINGTKVEIKPHGHLYAELYRAINDPKSNIRDERPRKNKLDAINAAEHSLSYFRWSLFK